MRVKHFPGYSVSLVLVCGLLSGAWERASAQASATTTTLAVTSGGSAVTSVAAGAAVTLTATVVAGTTPVTPGQVNFCNAAAAHCSDVNLLGTAQLTSSGTAVFRFRPVVGNRSYKAVFAGTATSATSSSTAASLTVTQTGLSPTATSISEQGNAQATYSVGAWVGTAGTVAPTGTVSFLDTSFSNAVLGTSNLVPSAGIFNSYPAPGVSPLALTGQSVTADFNGDGIPDLAVLEDETGSSAGSLTIYLGNGDGSFTATNNPDFQSGITSFVVGDFNGDGILDLAVGVGYGILTFLGNGDGTFTVKTSPNASTQGYTAWILAQGDFNGDGNQDFIALVGNFYGFSDEVFLGQGDGTFTTNGQTFTGSQFVPPYGAAGLVADFNGDGIPDFAVESCFDASGQYSYIFECSVDVYLGKGDGTFPTSTNVVAGQPVFTLAEADFNGDGKPDLLVGIGNPPGPYDGGDGQEGGGSLALYLGNGDGTFTASPSPTSTGTELGAVVADFNGDGIPDIWVPTLGASNSTVYDAVYFLGKGDGTFTATLPFPLPNQGLAASFGTAADVNGDGIPDILFAGQPVLLTKPENSNAPSTSVTLPPATGTHLVAASYAGDSNNAASVSPTVGLISAQAASTVAVTSSANPVAYGAAVTFTATVTGVGFTPTGTVTFLDSGVQLGTATLAGGQGTFTPTSLTYGAHFITVTYAGDVNYLASTGSLTEAVERIGATTTTTSLAITSGGTAVSTVSQGTAVNLTASATAGGTPITAGTVQFCDTAVNGLCNLPGIVGSAQLTSSGMASLTVRPGIGTHSYQALFYGTTTNGFSASTKAALTVTGKYATASGFEFNNQRFSSRVRAVGPSGMPAPAGSVQYIDTNHGNKLLNTGTLSFLDYETSLFANAPQAPPTGTKPFALVEGDFNHDGIPDLAVANSGTNDVSVLIGNGDGSYKTQVTYPVGGGAYAIAAGDFNGDGNPDLAVTNFSANTVSILLGKSDGTFGTQQTYATGGGPDAVAVGDFNGDGILDLAVANNSDGTVSILLGNGDGTFQTQQTYATGKGPASVAVGDWNGDGIPDLAVANNSDGTVSVLLGKADGTFLTQVPYTAGKNPTSVTDGDFTGNGTLDLAVANLSDNTISVFMGNGDGTFGGQTTYASAGGPYAIVAGNLSGEGNVDLAVAGSGANTVTVFQNHGDGAFTAVPSFQTGASPFSLAIADMNGDWLPDLAVLSNSGNTVNVLLNESGARSQDPGFYLPVVGTHEIEAAYLGNANFDPSTSGLVSVYDGGQGISTKLTLSSSANPSNYGTPLTLTATLNPYTDYVSTDGEGVAFLSGSTTLGTGTLAAGVATFTTSALPVGATSVQALYTTDGFFDAASSSVISLTIRPATLVVTGSNATRAYGAANPALSATVSGAVNGDTFTATATTSAAATSPVGAYPVVPSVTGSDLSAYNVDLVNGALTVTKASPAVQVTPAISTLGTNQSLSVTVAVNGPSGVPSPSGTVTLSGGGYTSAATTLSSGSATIVIPASSLAQGNDTLTASYSGDANDNAETNTAAIVVTAPVPPGFTVAGTAVTVSAGATTGNTSTITLTPAGGFTGAVSLTCAITPTAASDPATCSLPGSASITGTAAQTVTLTVNTTAATSAMNHERRLLWPSAGGTLLALVLLFGIPARRRKWRTIVGMVVLMAGLAAVVSCGGGGNSGGGGGGGGNPGTTPGTYTITVSGTSGSLSAKVTIALTVE